MIPILKEFIYWLRNEWPYMIIRAIQERAKEIEEWSNRNN